MNSGLDKQDNALWLDGCNLFLMLNNARRRERGEFASEIEPIA